MRERREVSQVEVLTNDTSRGKRKKERKREREREREREFLSLIFASIY